MDREPIDRKILRPIYTYTIENFHNLRIMENAPEETPKTAVLTDISLLNLGKSLNDNDIRAFLLLNIPLTKIVNFYEEMRQLNQRENAFKQRTIMYWKEMRQLQKEKMIVNDLEFALRESDHKELADILVERNRMNLEITRDLLQN